MSFSPHLPEPIYKFTAGVKAAADKLAQSGLFRKAAERISELRVRAQPFIQKLAAKLPPEKRRPALIASIGVCAVFVLVFAGISLLAGNRDGRAPAPAERAPVRQGLIPADDLFLPDEPDFVPGVLLEREQRAVWTADDAVPLWQDPLKNGEEPWRNHIERTIDEIMESVP
jgi:hypothetical protein